MTGTPEGRLGEGRGSQDQRGPPTEQQSVRTGRDLEGIRGLEGNTASDSPNRLGPGKPAGVLGLNLSPPGPPSGQVGPGGVGVRERGRKSGGVRGPAPLRGGGGRRSHTEGPTHRAGIHRNDERPSGDQRGMQPAFPLSSQAPASLLGSQD